MDRSARARETALVRRDRRIGNWGRASEHIGARWEDVGSESLRPLLEGSAPWPKQGYRPVGWVALAGDAEMQARLNRAGLPSPDYAAHTIVAHLYDYAFIRFEMGYASAVAVVLFVITFLLGRIAMKIFSSND
jgi:hypothetical protein